MNNKVQIISYFKKSLFFYLSIAWWIIASILLIIITKGDLVLYCNSQASSFLDTLFRLATLVGESVVVISIAIIVMLYRYYYGVITALSLILTGIVASLCKNLFFTGIARPTKHFPAETFTNLIEGFDYHSWESFPSGHTMTAFAIMGALSIVFSQRWFSVLVFVLALGVAISRMYLLQHFLIDVFVGSFLGVTNAIFAVFITNKIFNSERSRTTSLLKKT